MTGGALASPRPRHGPNTRPADTRVDNSPLGLTARPRPRQLSTGGPPNKRRRSTAAKTKQFRRPAGGARRIAVPPASSLSPLFTRPTAVRTPPSPHIHTPTFPHSHKLSPLVPHDCCCTRIGKKGREAVFAAQVSPPPSPSSSAAQRAPSLRSIARATARVLQTRCLSSPIARARRRWSPKRRARALRRNRPPACQRSAGSNDLLLPPPLSARPLSSIAPPPTPPQPRRHKRRHLIGPHSPSGN